MPVDDRRIEPPAIAVRSYGQDLGDRYPRAVQRMSCSIVCFLPSGIPLYPVTVTGYCCLCPDPNHKVIAH
jgi:hypothetical protein